MSGRDGFRWDLLFALLALLVVASCEVVVERQKSLARVEQCRAIMEHGSDEAKKIAADSFGVCR